MLYILLVQTRRSCYFRKQKPKEIERKKAKLLKFRSLRCGKSPVTTARKDATIFFNITYSVSAKWWTTQRVAYIHSGYVNVQARAFDDGAYCITRMEKSDSEWSDAQNANNSSIYSISLRCTFHCILRWQRQQWKPRWPWRFNFKPFNLIIYWH